MSIKSTNYDLEERTLFFSKNILQLCRSLPSNRINYRLVDQCIRSSTSVGANYREANETDTVKDFKHRIRISKKETKETIYWLQLIVEANPTYKKAVEILLDEAMQLMKILVTIYKKAI